MTPDQQIFQQGSRTYYNSTLLFPRQVREDVIKLYSFMRVADDYVDSIPQRLHEFRNLVATWEEYRGKPMAQLAVEDTDSLNVRVTKNLCRLVLRHRINPKWVDDFLFSMELDTRKKSYHTLDDTLRYVRGSAEVVGLMMARIMRVPMEAMKPAAFQGRAMQFINFLRDIGEDLQLGRCYFPKTDLQEFGLGDLTETTTKARPDAFREFIRFELGRCNEWQRVADEGMPHVPRRCRVPVQAAIDSYHWTARQIAKDPFVVYHRKVRPSRARIMGSALTHVFD